MSAQPEARPADARPAQEWLARMCAAAFVLLAGSLCAAHGVAAGSAPAEAPPLPASCTQGQPEERTVAAVIDGETVRLDDGREVRLVGVLAPRATDVHAATPEWPPETDAKHALERLASGRTIRFFASAVNRDRYGRWLAHVLVRDVDGGEQWLQGALLSQGHARASTFGVSAACGNDLLAAEAPARTARAGLWNNPVYAPRPAWQSRILSRSSGTYQLVEGKVRRVARVGGRIHLDFGPDWRSDFTVTIAPALQQGEPAWTSHLLDAAGRKVRVRGWIDLHSGPMIEVVHAGQIEFME